MKFKNAKIIEVQDWDDLVVKTYNKPYSFQQQDGCQDRGTFNLTIPCKYTNEDEMNDTIPEVINGEKMGVKFDVWLNTDPKTHTINNKWDNWETGLFWDRNFYPDVYTLANDLHSKGLIDVGDYVIEIDW